MAQGLNPRGLASGFQSGFGMMADYQAQQRQMDMQEAQEERAQEQFETQQELRALKIDKARDEMNRSRAKQGLQQLAEGQPPGEETLSAMNELGIEPRKLVTGEYLDAAKKLQGAMAGQQTEAVENTQDAMAFEGGRGLAMAPGEQQASPQAQRRTADALNDPEIIDAANTFLESRVRRGVGDEVDLPESAGGGRGRVLNKRIKGMTPMQGGTVGMDLEVTARNEDGEIVSYTAPATQNRSSDPDDPVQGLPIDELMDHAAGLTQEAKAFQMDPQARENARQALYQMDPDMRPERKIVDLGPRGKAIQTTGADGMRLQPIPGTGEGQAATTAGQEYQELLRQGVPDERARAIAYGEPDSGGGLGDYKLSQRADDLEKLSGRRWGKELEGGGFTFPSEDAAQMADLEQSIGEQVMRQHPEITPGQFHQMFAEEAENRVTPEQASEQARQDVERQLAGKSHGEGWITDGDLVPGETVNGVTWQEGEQFADFKERLIESRATELLENQPDIAGRVRQRVQQAVGQERERRDGSGEQEARQGDLPTVTSEQDYAQLAPGAKYRGPDGQIRQKRSQ